MKHKDLNIISTSSPCEILHNDTICAISTPSGIGAIAIVRLTGEDSLEIVDKIFTPRKKGQRIKEQAHSTIQLGIINNFDEVLVSVFRAPHSFTGENIVEISCHGSQYIQQQIVQQLISNGCRLALPGEFTLRAFLNGKIDLSQAEAVADIIASKTETANRIAFQQMRGGFSTELGTLRNRMLDFISLIELELDFSEEDVEFADRNQLLLLIKEIIEHIQKLVDSFSLGNAIKNGIPVAIVGNTNTGKSTLLNRLINEERAIVSDFHGTTRDAIEEVMNIDGIIFRFIDTAGIRATEDKIEKIGISITFNKIKKASIVALVVEIFDDNSKITKEADEILKILDPQHQKLIILLNKTDLADDFEIEEKISKLKLPINKNDIIPISAKNNINIDKLISNLLNSVNNSTIGVNETIVSNLRHYEALTNALISLKRVETEIINGTSGDLLSQDIREALHFIGSITGDIFTDDILENIFKNFCIGK
ncbi:MAG: tRNA uridine-5-carboxymethylaminomethyl(34) synthesis GTPase MnmE [Marinilabiliaceae bacterium]|nr:tRNA uridine-5-carboxymethylaminomethyl(34) synthesis GTPase MnmE [Marinilabiliaceae bacterium]